MLQLMQASAKPTSAALKPKPSGVKRSVSWNELHMGGAPMDRSNSGSLETQKATEGPQKALPSHKRLLSKLQNAGSQVLEKAHIAPVGTLLS